MDQKPFSLNTNAGAYPTADLLIFGSDYGHADFVTPMARFAFYDPYGVSQAPGSPIVFMRMGGTFQSGLVNGYSESANIFGTPEEGKGIGFNFETAKGGINSLYKQVAGGLSGSAGYIASAGASGKAQYEFISRKVLNTFQQLIYNGPTFRRFTLPFTMKPTSAEEAVKMINIIKTFRIASSPRGDKTDSTLKITGDLSESIGTKSGQDKATQEAAKPTAISATEIAQLFDSSAQNLTFGYPDICKFQIVLQQVNSNNQGEATDTVLAEVFGSEYCVIENIQVDYGSQNKMVFFTPDGTGGIYYPTEINLSIGLRETSLPLAGDIAANHSNEKRTIF